MAAALVLVVALAVLPGITAAQQQRSGGSVVVGPNETVQGDLDAFGGNVVVAGTVTGDLSAFGGNVRIEGTVEGDVEAVAGNVFVGPNATIGGSLEASAGTVTIAGRVAQDVEASAGSVTLAPTASIGDDLTYSGELTRAEGAVVAGSVSQGPVSGPFGGGPSIPGWAFTVYGLLVNALLGAVLLLAFPEFSRSLAASATDSPLRSGGVGLLALVGVPVALALVMVTVVGIPLALAGGLLYLLALWVGAVYGRYAVGTWLTAQAEVENRWLALAVGLVVVAVLTLVPVVGGLVELLVVLLGLGTLARGLRDRYRRARDREGPEEGAEPVEQGVSA